MRAGPADATTPADYSAGLGRGQAKSAVFTCRVTAMLPHASRVNWTTEEDDHDGAIRQLLACALQRRPAAPARLLGTAAGGARRRGEGRGTDPAGTRFFDHPRGQEANARR